MLDSAVRRLDILHVAILPVAFRRAAHGGLSDLDNGFNARIYAEFAHVGRNCLSAELLRPDRHRLFAQRDLPRRLSGRQASCTSIAWR